MWVWEVDGVLDSKLENLNTIGAEFKVYLDPFIDFVNELDNLPQREMEKSKSEYKAKRTGAAGPSFYANEIAKMIRENYADFGDNSIYQPDINYKAWYRYTMKVLNNDSLEKNDIEAKDGIFPLKIRFNGELVDVDLNNRAHVSKINEIAKERLRTLAAFYNFVGGIMIFGIKDATWEVLGIDKEIEFFGSLENWKDRVKNLVESASADFPRGFWTRCSPVIETVNIDGEEKTVFGIIVKAKPELSGSFAKWKINNNETFDHYYYRVDDSSVHFPDNPTAEDYEWLNNERIEKLEDLTFKTQGKLKEEVIESSRDFDTLYSDGFRIK